VHPEVHVCSIQRRGLDVCSLGVSYCAAFCVRGTITAVRTFRRLSAVRRTLTVRVGRSLPWRRYGLLLGYDAESLGNRFAAFRKNVMSSFIYLSKRREPNTQRHILTTGNETRKVHSAVLISPEVTTMKFQ
jgi:hypothetical protein